MPEWYEPKGLLHSAEIGVTASTLTADAVIELFFSLDKQYRKNAVWVMNDETAMTLRMLIDSTGNFLWRSTDDTIFSHTVVISNYINDSTIVFGDLSLLLAHRASAPRCTPFERALRTGKLSWFSCL